MAKKGKRKGFVGDERDPDALFHWVRRFLESMRVRAYSERTVIGSERALRAFVQWAVDRDLEHASQISSPTSRPISAGSSTTAPPKAGPSRTRRSVRSCRSSRTSSAGLTKQSVLLSNPASDSSCRASRRNCRAPSERARDREGPALADLTDALGLRDRAMMEVLYATGMRRHGSRRSTSSTSTPCSAP
ncbi:MAG: hypothetical protein IPG04_37980 [Polyangiaceae bacterium]|nr:hypothetical protein [Polyangiaceae bacterium]